MVDFPLTQYGQYTFLAKLYVLGERLVDDELQNRVIDGIIATTRSRINGVSFFPGVEAVNVIYNRTSASSLARQLLVHLWDEAANPRWITEFKLHPDFLEDITLALLKGRERTGQDKVEKRNRVLEPQAYYKSSLEEVGECEPTGNVTGSDVQVV